MKLGFTGLITVFLILIFSCSKSGSSGEKLYLANCSNCHMANGEGLGELIPSLSNTDIFSKNIDLACLIRNGKLATNQAESVTEQYLMPPNEIVSDIDITNILNYMREQWHPDSEQISLIEIKKSLSNCN